MTTKSPPTTYLRAGAAAVDAMVVRTTPAVLGLLADGVPRSRAAIVEALADRHHRTDITHTLIRLVATGGVIETGGEYALGAAGTALGAG
jgi:hypothetical protein